jgi:hypothetical protein
MINMKKGIMGKKSQGFWAIGTGMVLVYLFIRYFEIFIPASAAFVWITAAFFLWAFGFYFRLTGR